jgi:hypothetical protein
MLILFIFKKIKIQIFYQVLKKKIFLSRDNFLRQGGGEKFGGGIGVKGGG